MNVSPPRPVVVHRLSQLNSPPSTVVMRLLNIHKLKLQAFEDGERPPYAIVSHRWYRTVEELSKQELESGVKEASRGYKKIKGACRFVARRYEHLEWIWIDTCCIDKNNNVELGEAITSMYHWYSDAEVCLAYLWDIPERSHESAPDEDFAGPDERHIDAQTLRNLYESEWFRRGLYKNYITGIPADVLSRHGRALEPVNYADVIARLGWMDLRYTSKIEDRAYCLIGLCDIKSMYLHYGEKGNALPRLLREIRKQYGIQEPLNATRPAHESSPPAMDIDNPPPMTYPAAYLSEAQVAHNSAIATWLEYCRLYSSGLLEVEQVKSWLAHDLLNDGTFMEEARAVVEHRLAYVDTLPLDKRRMRFERAKL
ncbi:unnamed protein product [Zymoseptoria tritici ST99CH_1A5]|uniref:Heterokaryon incompatibility domain-containing protein n=1 Tax=Zymoseptoria tritici ST99CH_1A5 TaxID=1276529 RepID=A0A1Y6LUM1_ZYMTR|nr:unnamed protein product [Zymoseptoria tritici ST99CH_1A5]